MLEIDGSFGEGGGQIVRTSLALSLVTGTPFRMTRVRARRRRPGLLRQHLTAVRAAASVGRAAVAGAELGAASFVFEPGAIEHGDYAFAVGTAGSATLVCQTVLPALLSASGRSTVTFEGGTHNPMAPTFDFLDGVFLPVLRDMGAEITATLERYGFYPAGGGKFSIDVTGAAPWKRVALLERGEILRRRACAVVANLPRHIAQRELDIVERRLGWEHEALEIREVEGPGPGNVISLEVGSRHCAEIVTGFGEKGVRAETVASRAAKRLRAYVDANVPVGEHLADQLTVFMALAGGGELRMVHPTLHTETNIEVIRRFLDVPIKIVPDDGSFVMRVG